MTPAYNKMHYHIFASLWNSLNLILPKYYVIRKVGIRMRVKLTLAVAIVAFMGIVTSCPSAEARGYKQNYYRQPYRNYTSNRYGRRYRYGQRYTYGARYRGPQRYAYKTRYPHYNAAPANGGRAGAFNLAEQFKDVLESAMEQLRLEGVPDQHLRSAAAHLAGQAYAESGLNPNVYHDGGIGYGIYGANGARLARMRQWMAANKIPNTRAGQMRYMAHEAMTSFPVTRNILMHATVNRINSDVPVVTWNFESPSWPRNDIRIRAVKAFHGI